MPGQTDNTLLSPAVETALDAAEWLTPADQAAATLARVYARHLDAAYAAERSADRVLRRAERLAARTVDMEDLVKEVSALAAKLSARTTVATIGPKLENLLVELLGTPKARQKRTGAAAAPEQPVETGAAQALRLLRGSA